MELDRFTVTLTDSTANETAGSKLIGALDRPDPNEPVNTVFFVSGWLLHQTDVVSRVDVMVDGRCVGQARLGLPRFDIGSDHGGSDRIVSGFDRWVDLSSHPDCGPNVTVEVVAHRRDGSPTTLFERSVRITTPKPGPDRSERQSSLDGRRRQVVSRIDRPSSGDLDLAVFTHRIDYGGAQLWLDELLDKSGAGVDYRCTVYSQSDGALREHLEARGIAVHVTNEPPVGDIEQYEGRITELSALVAAGGHNAVLVNTAIAFSGADVARRLDLPVVWGIHESLPPEVFLEVAFAERPDAAVREAFYEALHAADALVFEAETTCQMYRPSARAHRALVVPYGVDTRAITEYCSRVSRADARADVGVGDDLRMILVMGTVEPRKAQTVIARASALLRSDHPDWTLVFVGGYDSVYSDAVQRYLKENGLTGKARVVPIDENTFRWYRAADVLLCALDMESLPALHVEATCFGATIVSTSVFGAPALLEDGKFGFLFEPSDLDRAVDAVDGVLALGAEELRAIGEAGRKHVLDHYDSAGYATDLWRFATGCFTIERSRPRRFWPAGVETRSRGSLINAVKQVDTLVVIAIETSLGETLRAWAEDSSAPSIASRSERASAASGACVRYRTTTK